MKIEIDLDEVFAEEGITIEDVVKNEVINNLTRTLSNRVSDKIEEEVNNIVTGLVKEKVAEKLPIIFESIIEDEYYPVDNYGDRSRTPTTFRKELTQAMFAQMRYTKGHERNMFTKAIDEIIGENIKEVKKEFDKTVNEALAKEAFEYAIDTLKKKLGIL